MWGVVWYPMRLLDQAGLDGLWQSLLIYVAAFVVSLPWTARCWREILKHPRLLLGLALAAGWTNVAFILAILDGNVLRVLLLFYLSPLWAMLLGSLFLGEQVGLHRWLTLLLALIGAMLMLWNPEQGMPWPRDAADWLALSSGIAFAVSNVLVRKGQGVTLAAKVGTSWLGVILVASVLILWQAPPTPGFATGQLLGAAAVGIFGILVMTTLVQYGVTHLPVQRSAVILLFELVAGALSQQWLTNEVMLPLEWLGGGLIMLAAYVSARR